jgi:hypothetical protein
MNSVGRSEGENAHQARKAGGHYAATNLDNVPSAAVGQGVGDVVGRVGQIDPETIDAGKNDVAPQQEDEHEQAPLPKVGFEPQDVGHRKAEDGDVAEDARHGNTELC